MPHRALLSCLAALSLSALAADTPTAKPIPVITPGQVIIPFEKMRRIWGELISLDLTSRTGKFRNESNNEVMSFTVMPYAELLHHATLGDLQDFKVGERAIFRLHVNDKEQWVWLTYIQDEMNMMNGHKEYFHVDQIDAAAGKLTCIWANADQSFVREKNVVIETDKNTHFWKAGQPAKFSDIKAGDKLRTKTHGIGKGKNRMAWEVFFDDESLLKFQAEQKAMQAKRILEEGAPGYVDASSGTQLTLTLFNEGDEQIKRLKQGTSVQVAPAGVDRKPTAAPIAGKVTTLGKNGRQVQVTLGLTASGEKFQPIGLARLWVVQP
ncbi:MAG: hypothetical protein NTY98_29125 [Verrucomicrobia bacterium]|nr:hypothetical protein [Verrucomicrobiota bacterium]